MPYPFTLKAATAKKSPGKNPDKYIILHHTAGGTFESNVKTLSGPAEGTRQVSVHFVVGKAEECAKIGDPADKLWHAGESSWGSDVGLNNFSMGIEIVGAGEYNIHQFMRVTDLVEYLMYNFGIPKENVLRHSDITQTNKALRDQKILWDGKQQARKTDVALTFFPGGFTTWRDQLVPRKDSRYAA